MSNYQAESFYRAKISTSIISTQTVPITVRLTKLPTVAGGLLTISPNTEYEEIVEYDNINSTNMTIDIIKRGINPSSVLLTTDGTDYNNTTYQKDHTQNDIIRGDVNHIHINQSIGNTTLATNTGVGISKLSVAAVDVGDPIVVGDNDPRVAPMTTTVKGIAKISTAPVDANNPIVVGDNDSRLDGFRYSFGSGTLTTSSGITTVTLGWQPKIVRITASNSSGGTNVGGYSIANIYYDGTNVVSNMLFVSHGAATMTQQQYNGLSTDYAFYVRDDGSAWTISSTISCNSTSFSIAAPTYIGTTNNVAYSYEVLG